MPPEALQRKHQGRCQELLCSPQRMPSGKRGMWKDQTGDESCSLRSLTTQCLHVAAETCRVVGNAVSHC